jgi:hypothetical protein
MTSLLADARLALRVWRTSPVFTAIAIVSIALGIGANTAIFTLVDQVMLRTLPVADPGELVQISFTGARYGSNWGDGSEISYPMYADLRDNNGVFDGVFGRFGFALQTGFGGRTERVAGELVSGTYFPVLGVRPVAGRLFTSEEDRSPGGHPYAVLSHAFWTTRFGADPGVIDSSIVVNGHAFTVIGVAESGFDGVELGRPVQVWVPIMMKAQLTPGWNGLDDRRFNWVRAFARLRPGVTPDQARAALQPYYQTLLEQEVKEPAFANAAPATRDRFLKNQISVIDASRGRSGFRRSMTTPLWVLMATAAGTADCLREHRKPPAGARRGASARAGRPPRAWRNPRPPGTAAPRREHAAGACGWSRRDRGCVGRCAARPQLLRQPRHAAADFNGAGLADPRVHLRRRNGDRHPVRARARRAVDTA